MKAPITKAAIALLILAACGSDGYSPTQPATPFSPLPPAALSSLIGAWSGSTRVTSHEGREPDCLPRFLQHGSTDVLAAEIFTQGVGPLLYLEQEAIGGACYFFLSLDTTSARATPYGSDAWGYDQCQVKLDTSSWGCSRSAPEASISNIAFEGRWTDTSMTRIQGTLRLDYRHRTDATQPYAYFAVTEDFNLAKAGA
jgi:hypothetical protein